MANYDLVNSVAVILDNVLDPFSGALEERAVKFGSDGGVRRYYVADADAINGGALRNTTTYHFKVDAYSYDPDGLPEKTLTSQTVISGSPQPPAAEITYPNQFEDTIAVTHPAGGSDGIVTPYVLDPRAFTGDSYLVTFDTTDAGVTFWSLYNVTADSMVIDSQFNLTGDEDYYVIDGVLMKVQGPDLGVNLVQEVAGADGVIDPPDNVKYSLNSTGEWYVSSDAGSDFSRMNWRGYIGTYDWEFRFTADSTQYYDWNTDVLQTDLAPFEVWNIGIGTPDDPSDDVQINFSYIDDDTSGIWSWSDRIYTWEQPYVEPAPATPTYVWDDDFWIGRIQFNLYDGTSTAPAVGTIVRFTTNKIITVADTFAFTLELPTVATEGGDVLDAINVVPNPFYLYGPYDPAVGNYQLKFQHLPATCTIDIYNLAGDFIASVEKDDPTTSIATWNLRSRNGLPVASGIYIYVVEAPDFGTKVGKMAVFTEVEVLDIY